MSFYNNIHKYFSLSCVDWCVEALFAVDCFQLIKNKEENYVLYYTQFNLWTSQREKENKFNRKCKFLKFNLRKIIKYIHKHKTLFANESQ